MNLDLLLLKLFLTDLKLYDKYKRYIVGSNNLYAKLYKAVEQIGATGKGQATVEELALQFHTSYPIISPTEANLLEPLFNNLQGLSVTPEQAQALLTKLRERSLASEIALKAVEVAADEATFTELSELIKQSDDQIEEPVEQDFVTDNIVEIQTRYSVEPPFKFRLRTLNKIFGGLHRRTFGFVFARPETGKTQFVVSEAVYLATQVKSCVLWINNEEDGFALITRLYQAALRKQSHEIFANTEKAREAYQSKIKGRIRIYDRPQATQREIERLVREHRPDVVFIDQLDKVRGATADRYDLLQKALYQWARELAKKYNCAVVGICQAGGSAENKRYLDMNDVDSSHTAKQGEADWMMGLGSTDQIGQEDRRFVSVCKNKLPVVPEMDTNMRHAKIPIKSIPEYQIYEDAINI